MLSRRELEVAALVAQELTIQEIAGALCISPHTVVRHLKRSYDVLGVRGRVGLALWFVALEPS